MDPNSFRMFMAASDSGLVLPAIGAAFQGGYYAGSISQNADGTATHALIVCDKDKEVSRQFKTTQTSTTGIDSTYDGASNTTSMDDSSHPAAQYCAGLSTGGYSDWYLPALYELEIAYYNLKPSTDSNNTSFGSNSFAVPARTSNYTTSNPGQTSVSIFQAGGDANESFDTDSATYRYWTSTQESATDAYGIRFTDGRQVTNGKTATRSVRPFRKVAL